jgi:hypothetical protein
MTWFHKEPSLEQLLSDPVALSMMEADNVDPVAFRQMLDKMSQRLRHDHLV